MVFERKNNVKAPPRIGRMNKFALVDLIKYEVGQLSSLAHPRILHVQHSLEDTKEFLAFGCEAVYASLDSVVIEEGIERLEMKLGVLQIIDGLSYLHNSAKILHGNLTPASIYVTSSRLWKIAGFSFAVAAKEPLNEALNCISEELGSNLRESMGKVLSLDVEVRPTVQLLALIKHFDDPALSALRQLDDISQMFDPSQKAHFLGQTFVSALPVIPE
ncbi:hypothetical protein OSTOST_11772, partial [Ostertagia ostertagi]